MTAPPSPRRALPRGPHSLSREEVARSQRDRLLAAFTELLAERGFAAVTIGELAKRAAVSRAAFYEHFADKTACLNAAYAQFAENLVAAMTPPDLETMSWDGFVEHALGGYLRAIEADTVAARAFIIEMDAAGPDARQRRNNEAHVFARMFGDRHEALLAERGSGTRFPEPVYLAITLGVRELVRETLINEENPRVTALMDDIVTTITALVEGPGAAQARIRG
ncbi:MAG: TetR/AcrR family transcriptional regulator [Solirubrobacteraceae bacterium]|nr:TetR/AcrR family transcriptional regulator [Solirubrobacteraceae bacterium]